MQHVLPDTTIYSDGWAAYSEINNILTENGFQAYNHGVVIHENNFVDPITGIHTNNAEGLWSNAKSIFKEIRGTSLALQDSYLD